MGEETKVIYEKNPSPDTLAGHDLSYAIVTVGEAPCADFSGGNSELVIPSTGADTISSVADELNPHVGCSGIWKTFGYRTMALGNDRWFNGCLVAWN